jgi:acyl dehydratase
VTVKELSSSPSLALIYPKAVGGAALPLVRKLPGVGDAPAGLPDEELVLRGAEIDEDRLHLYCRVCTFEIRDSVPATYPHLLAFPLAMQLMTDGSFPFPVMGLVHIENRIEQLRPIGTGERLDIRVRTADLRDHERGRQFDVLAEAQAGGETVWRSASTYLRRGGGSGGSSSKGGDDRPQPPAPDTTLTVPGDIGRRYAAVSGDRNPIHLHPVSARLFGMPRPIAHGMWLKARCLALLEGTLPDAFEVSARFKLPLYIPGKVNFAAADGSFEVHDANNQKPHLSGVVAPRSG